MTVKVTKSQVNLREKLAEVDSPSGIAGEAMLRAETPQEQQALIGVGRRNMIINGAMAISQRSTSESISGNGFTVDTVDRIKTGRNAIDELVFTASQSTDAPDGFSNSFKLDVTTAETTIAADEYCRVQYSIEGQDLQGVAYGTSSAKNMTLSFWVKSNKTGNYACAFYRDESTDRIFSLTYSINVANTWEKKILIIPADTVDPITNDNAGRFQIQFYFLVGSNYTVNKLTNWVDYTAVGQFAYGHDVNWGTSTSDDFYITGIQLELGKVATPFEYRSYGEELALCQRYYQNSFDAGEAPTHNSLNAVYRYIEVYSGTAVAGLDVSFPVVMRATPTCTLWTASPSSNTSTGRITFYDGSSWSNDVAGIHESTSSKRISVLTSNASSTTKLVQFNFEADAEL